jgi:hypothetical protein
MGPLTAQITTTATAARKADALPAACEIALAILPKRWETEVGRSGDRATDFSNLDVPIA